MMPRVVEPELMDEPAQAQAYSRADFDSPHGEIINQFARAFKDVEVQGDVLDLGCGPADITTRFAQRYPRCRIDAVDGASAMLSHGRSRIARAGLSGRVRFLRHVLPDESLPRAHYTTVISTSVLHHLHEPAVLWATIKQVSAPAARVFVADLRRPEDPRAARAMVDQYAAGEPAILRRDFYNSLRAAFTITEVEAQLADAGLNSLEVEAMGDRHLIVWGTGE